MCESNLNKAQPISINRVLVGTIIGLCVVAALTLNLVGAFPREKLNDFGSFVATGRLAEMGENPYTAQHPLVFQAKIPKLNLVLNSVNLNPPISIPFFIWLAQFQPTKAINAWRLISIALYLLTSLILITYYRPRRPLLMGIWLLQLAGVWHTIGLGQIYMPLVLLVACSWILLERKAHLSAGFLIGIMIAVKPNFAIWAVMLVVGGYFSAGIAAIAVAGILSTLPIFLYGIGIYRQWLEASAIFSTLGVIVPGNSSLMSTAARMGTPQIGILLSLLLVVGTVIWVWHQRYFVRKINAISMILALLASPLAWSGYTLFLLPIFLSQRWTRLHWVAAGLLCVPMWLTRSLSLHWTWGLVIFGGLYSWAIIALFVAVLSSEETSALRVESTSR